ncbi:transposase [Leifsonia sp. P73]|uniref:transposase n=1 Tax=Leifsonia sp. P73 TaxID=3423959 RepID=UPI003DA1D1A5
MSGDRAANRDGEVDGAVAGGSTHSGRGDTWRFRTGAPWRDVPERFGNWNTIYKNFNRWSARGVWARVFRNRSGLLPHWVFPGALLARVQAQSRVSSTS